MCRQPESCCVGQTWILENTHLTKHYHCIFSLTATLELELLNLHIFSCPKVSSIGDEVTGGAAAANAAIAAAAILWKSREVPGKCRGGPGK